jgi:hypothetical protein
VVNTDWRGGKGWKKDGKWYDDKWYKGTFGLEEELLMLHRTVG